MSFVEQTIMVPLKEYLLLLAISYHLHRARNTQTPIIPPEYESYIFLNLPELLEQHKQLSKKISSFSNFSFKIAYFN